MSNKSRRFEINYEGVLALEPQSGQDAQNSSSSFGLYGFDNEKWI